jgi:hypothetical protein
VVFKPQPLTMKTSERSRRASQKIHLNAETCECYDRSARQIPRALVGSFRCQTLLSKPVLFVLNLLPLGDARRGKPRKRPCQKTGVGSLALLPEAAPSASRGGLTDRESIPSARGSVLASVDRERFSGVVALVVWSGRPES